MSTLNSASAFALQPESILFEDNHVLVVVKPAGCPMQPDSSGQPSLYDLTKEWLKQKYQKPGNVFLGLVHRLDKPVSGVVLFAKTSKGASRLSEQVRRREFVKTYWARVENAPPTACGRLEGFVRREGDRTWVCEAGEEGSQAASLEYRTVPGGDPCLLEINLETGRKHQIRAQLAHLGCPIVGDARYGARSNFAAGIGLVAVELVFAAATKADAKIRVALPASLNPLLQQGAAQ